MLSNASNCRLISVGYRLAPEHPLPEGIDDATIVTSWISANAGELHINADHLVVGSDSAGATIAAVVCQRARSDGPRIALQVLLCPVTDLLGESESRLSFAQGYFLERTTFEWAKSAYCAGVPLSDPRVSPLRADSFAGLPPAIIHTAEFDPMRDEGEAYARALESEGVSVRYVCHAGLIHHFYCMGGAIPKAREVLASLGGEIRAAVNIA